MRTADVLREFEEAGALQRGHFVLSSGLHSDIYFNKSVVSMHPARTERLCRGLADKAREAVGGEIDFIVSPAMGAIIYGYETARQMGLRFMFVERVGGEFQLRRGFSLPKGARVLVVEDVITTGLSARECVAAVRRERAEAVGLACLVDRSAGTADVGAPLIALVQLKAEAWPADRLPAHLAAVPAVKPGSRGVSQ